MGNCFNMFEVPQEEIQGKSPQALDNFLQIFSNRPVFRNVYIRNSRYIHETCEFQREKMLMAKRDIDKINC